MQNSRIRAALMGLIVACSASMSMGDYADKQAPASSASITQTHAKVPAVPDNRASDSLFADRLAAMRRSVLLVRENVLSVVCHETVNRRDSNHPNITTVGVDIAVVEGQEQPLGILQGTTLSRSFKPLKRWMRGEFFGNLDSTQAALADGTQAAMSDKGHTASGFSHRDGEEVETVDFEVPAQERLWEILGHSPEPVGFHSQVKVSKPSASLLEIVQTADVTTFRHSKYLRGLTWTMKFSQVNVGGKLLTLPSESLAEWIYTWGSETVDATFSDFRRYASDTTISF